MAAEKSIVYEFGGFALESGRRVLTRLDADGSAYPMTTLRA